ncbi:MAG TPA: AzlD domain-containing protein [Steroidobacteraceae bacterium]|nr:AzlD domain-containing protein [Steroidobacteraceae bacterium]
MSDELATWIAIVGIALTAIATRGSFVVFGARLALPPLVEQALRFAPAAVLGAIVAPALLLQGGHADLSVGNHRLIAALLGGLLMWRTRSMLWTIAGGMAALTLLRLYA